MIKAEEAKTMAVDYQEKKKKSRDEEITRWLDEVVHKDIKLKAEKGGFKTCLRVPENLLYDGFHIEKILGQYGYKSSIDFLGILEIRWE